MVSKTPSPRVRPASSARAIGVSTGTGPRARTARARVAMAKTLVNTMGGMALPSLTDALRSRGLRMTVQRQLVMEAVERLGHATPEQVHGQVTRTAAGINLTTVYRTLELLEQIGLVRHTHLIDTATT